MCGRGRCTVRVDGVGLACGFRAPLRSIDSDRFRPSYNVSPGRYMPVVRHDTQAGGSEKDHVEPVVHCMKWGLIPSFSKKSEKPDHFRMFNARSESVHLKPSFSRLLPKSRCITTMEGFYEWKKDGTKSQPYYVHFKDGRPLVFAGLYDTWKDEEGNHLYTFTILTTRSSKALDWLHDRMPVILPNKDSIDSWMNDDLREPISIHKLTQPYEASDLVWYPVTTAMGKPMFDNPECVKEIKPKVAGDSKIAQMFGKASKITETALPSTPIDAQSSQEEIPDFATGEEGEDSLTEDDRKALLAGMEPDQDISEVVQKGQQIPDTVNSESQENEVDPAVKFSPKEIPPPTREGAQFSKRSLELSPVKRGGKDSPVSKLQKLSASPRAAKKGNKELPNGKQPTLLSFFGKQ